MTLKLGKKNIKWKCLDGCELLTMVGGRRRMAESGDIGFLWGLQGA